MSHPVQLDRVSGARLCDDDDGEPWPFVARFQNTCAPRHFFGTGNLSDTPPAFLVLDVMTQNEIPHMYKCTCIALFSTHHFGGDGMSVRTCLVLVLPCGQSCNCSAFAYALCHKKNKKNANNRAGDKVGAMENELIDDDYIRKIGRISQMTAIHRIETWASWRAKALTFTGFGSLSGRTNMSKAIAFFFGGMQGEWLSQ